MPDDEPEDDESDRRLRGLARRRRSSSRRPPRRRRRSAAPVAAAGAERPADLSYTAADATKTLAALRTKVRPDQIGTADTIEALCDGVSSRRNQLLVDLGAELSLGAIDGAAEADWNALSATVTKLARTYSPVRPGADRGRERAAAQVRRRGGQQVRRDRRPGARHLAARPRLGLARVRRAGRRPARRVLDPRWVARLRHGPERPQLGRRPRGPGRRRGTGRLREHARHRWWRGCDGRLRCAGRAERRRSPGPTAYSPRRHGTCSASSASPTPAWRPTPTRTSTPSS